MNQSPVEQWKRRLAYLQQQQAILADPALKFQLQEQIEECHQKIKELAKTESITPNPYNSNEGESPVNFSEAMREREGSRRIDRNPGLIAKFVSWLFGGNEREAKEVPFQTGLLELPVNREGETRGNIVFVHGLGADRRLTWHCQEPGQSDWDENNFWPCWLGEDLPSFKVWLFGYNAKKFFLESGRAAPRYDQASNLLGYLKAEQLDRYPLWFVCHSLGGLVVKEMLQFAQNHDEPILQCVKGVVFLATPHLGSDVARLGKSIGDIFQLFKLSISAEELQANSTELRKLNQWYQRNASNLNIRTFPFYETYKTKTVLVVDRDSADPGVANQETPIAVDKDHIGIAKCDSRSSLVYKSVKNFIGNPISKNNPFISPTLQKEYEQTENRNNLEPNPDRSQVTIGDDDLYKALRGLNFSNQCNQAINCITTQSIISFLLCGSKEYGMEILLERLCNQKSYRPIIIDLSSCQGIDAGLIWEKVAIELECLPDNEKSIDLILSEIVKIQQQQDILFILKAVDTVPSQIIADIMSDFWNRIIERININNVNCRDKRLLLFLIDYQNKYKDNDSLMVNDKLLLNNFTQDDIANWIESFRSQKGASFCDELKLDCMQALNIFRKSEGIPNRVYQEIYGYFDLAWQRSKMIRKLET